MIRARIQPSRLVSNGAIESLRNAKRYGFCRFHLGFLSNHLPSFPLNGRKYCCQLLKRNGKLYGAPTRVSIRAESNEGVLGIDKEENEVRRGLGVSGKFSSAVGLIIGTAVGPGILGLPVATINAGILPSTVAILGSWVYVISSILLVAELSCGVMEDKGVDEVSFTGLAMHTLGDKMGILVAVVYAVLNYALLVACIAGLGSLVQTLMPFLSSLVACAVFPVIVGWLIRSGSFKAIDGVNRVLCVFMLISITALVGVGVFGKRECIFDSLSHEVWAPDVVFPAVPVTVLTLGFHVITPYICTVLGRKPRDAFKAICCGGVVPLAMVLSWNTVILGLAQASTYSRALDPIKLLLSLNSSVLPAVQAFIFTALGTTLIGYALSFPKQLYDTNCLISTVVQEHAKAYLGNFSKKTEVGNCSGTGKVAERSSTGNGSGTEVSLDDLLAGQQPGIMSFSGQQEIALDESSSSGYRMKKSAHKQNCAQHEANIQTLNLVSCGEEDINLSVNSFAESEEKKLALPDIGTSSSGSKDDIFSTETAHLSSPSHSKSREAMMVWVVLAPPTLISAFFPKVFAVALDFAGVYANCFLFGVLPPLMAWIYRYNNLKRGKGERRSEVLVGGGKGTIGVLFAIAIFLGFRLPS